MYEYWVYIMVDLSYLCFISAGAWSVRLSALKKLAQKFRKKTKRCNLGYPLTHIFNFGRFLECSQLKMTFNFWYLTMLCEYSAIIIGSRCLNLIFDMCSCRYNHCRNEKKMYSVPFSGKCINSCDYGIGYLIPKLRINIIKISYCGNADSFYGTVSG